MLYHLPTGSQLFTKKWATGKVVAETEPEITRLVQPSDMKPSQYDDKLVTKNLCCGAVYEEYALSKIFIESLDASIRHSVCEHWEDRNKANLHDLAFYATSRPRG